jgi:hypothetical protein
VLEVKTVWAAFHLQLMLKRPIMEWQSGVHGRFFAFVYDALSGTLPISSKEFSVVVGNQLSDVRARYAIYGGASTISLSADALHFDFPSLLLSDQPVVENILSSMNDGFPKAFPELSYDKFTAQSYRHLEFVNAKNTPTEYLSQLAPPKLRSEIKSVVVQPNAKFELVAENQTWTCSVGVEKSSLNARAVFVVLSMTINGVDPLSPYQEKAQRVRGVMETCQKLLGLEVNNASG